MPFHDSIVLRSLALTLTASCAACVATGAETDAEPLGTGESALTALAGQTTATARSGPDQCRPGYAPPQCTARPFDTSSDVAFSGNGTALPAVAGSTLAGHPAIHAAQFVNDGFYGNGASWIAGSADSWIKIDLGQPTLIDGVRFGRDRTGKFDDRDPGQFVVEVATQDGVYADGDDSGDALEYTPVYDSAQDGFSGSIGWARTVWAGFAPVTARFVKLRVSNAGAAIDEIEVNPAMSAVPATPAAGPDQHRLGYPASQGLARPYDTTSNLASPANGSALPAVAGSTLAGYPAIHAPEYANDGFYGNGASWIAGSPGSWVKIDLGRVARVSGVRFGRDRAAGFDDRDPGQVRVELAINDSVYANGDDGDDASEYAAVFDSAQGGHPGLVQGAETLEARFPARIARFVKVLVQNDGTALDEIEVLGFASSPPSGPPALAPAVNTPQLLGPSGVTTDDLNGDGLLDVVIVNDRGGNAGSVTVLLGRGGGALSEGMTFEDAGVASCAVVTGDFDGDGKIDVLTADGTGVEQFPNTVSLFRGHGDGTLRAPLIFPTDGPQTSHLVAADFDGDGDLDVATTAQISDTIRVLLGDGAGGFAPSQGYSTSGGYFQMAIAAGDLNGDGHPDLVTTQKYAYRVGVFLGNGDGTFQPQVSYATAPSPHGLALADADGDGALDAVVTVTGGVSFLRGHGDGTLSAPVTSPVAGGGYLNGLVLGDLDGDARLDAAVLDHTRRLVLAMHGNGDGTFGSPAESPIGQNPTSNAIALGDVDGDGLLDVLATSRNSFQLHFLRNLGPF